MIVLHIFDIASITHCFRSNFCIRVTLLVPRRVSKVSYQPSQENQLSFAASWTIKCYLTHVHLFPLNYLC